MSNVDENTIRGWQTSVWNPFARSIYRRRFRQPFGEGHLYYGVYTSHAQAQAEAERLASRSLPASYDLEAAGRIYRSHLDKIRVSDYPLVYWLGRIFTAGARSVFDLGGNIGVTYYAFERYLDYPPDLRWTVHDLPHAMAAGEKWARTHDAPRRLRFSDTVETAAEHDVLVSTGALQYLPYSLPELIDRLQPKPPHLLINLTPMHEEREFFTLQNLGIAICPYRVGSIPRLLEAMQTRGYTLVDRWISHERRLEVPFHPQARVDGYSGFHFKFR